MLDKRVIINMITIIDKVIYGLGALTFVGVGLVIIGLVLFFLAAITMGIVDSFKKVSGKENKLFGGSNERKNRDRENK